MTAATIISFADAARSVRGSAVSRAESTPGHERRSSPAGLTVDAEIAADLLLAMENHPLAETAIWIVQGTDRRYRVAVRVGTGLASALMEPRDARFTADILLDEMAFAGCVGVAERLNEAADQAEAGNGLPRGRSNRRGRVFRSSHATVICLAVIMAALFGAAIADTVGRWVGTEAALAAEPPFADVAIGD